MGLKNTSSNYGSIAKWIHWATALLFLGAYMSVYYRHWFTESRTPENWNALQLHLSIGISVAVLVVLRIIWRLTNKAPKLEPGTKFQHLLAHGGHFALYAIMIIMPLTGYLGTGAPTDYFFLFEIPKFADTKLFETIVTNRLGMTFETFEAPLDFVHKKIMGKWLVWILILGHAGAALYHHFIQQDRTLRKMTA